jgi:RNA polymerase sigma factor (sigma-70 family)
MTITGRDRVRRKRNGHIKEAANPPPGEDSSAKIFFVGFSRRRRLIGQMSESDLELLRKYSREGLEAAFSEVVRRNVDLVFSVALRKVRSRQLAEEVAQSVFLDLARNIGRLRPDTVVSAWLYQVAHRTAVDVIRREARREAREQTAVHMSSMDSSPDSAQPDWKSIEPLLDAEVEKLPESDRIAIVLRFFEGKSLGEVGRAIGLSEDSAQKRVSRALERLRGGLQRRGVTVGAGTLVMLMSNEAVHAAPAGLVSSIVGSVVSATVAGGGVAVAAAKSAGLFTMHKAAIGLAVAGAVGVAAYQTHRSNRLERELAAVREQVVILSADASGAAGAVAPNGAADRSEHDSLPAAWARLQAERDRLVAQRDAAERVARLYQEVAASRAAVGATNQFPSARHVTAARGRLMRQSVLMQEALNKRKLEDLSPEEQDTVRSGGVAMLGEVAAMAEAELQFSRREPEPEDPVDELTVFVFGALDLDERQFQQVYGLLRDLRSEEGGLGGSDKELSDEQQAALRALKADGKERLKALLTQEQLRLFPLLEPHLPLLRIQPAR